MIKLTTEIGMCNICWKDVRKTIMKLNKKYGTN